MSDAIFDAIQAEIERQDARWGGLEHDKGHEPFAWIAILTKRLGKAFDASEAWLVTEPRWAHLLTDRHVEMRRRFVQVAAVAVAAVRAIDAAVPVEHKLKPCPGPDEEAERLRLALLPGAGCHAGRQDGECNWKHCPQARDGESARSGRHCPLDRHDPEL